MKTMALFPLLGFLTVSVNGQNLFLGRHRIAKLESYVRECKVRPERAVIESEFLKTFRGWQANKVRTTMGYLNQEWEISDLLLVNDPGDRGLLFIHKSRGGAHSWEMFGAEQDLQGEWQFISAGLPSFTFKDFTREAALQRLKIKLIQDGLVGWFGKVKDRYLSERWFEKDRHRLHQQFLDDKL